MGIPVVHLAKRQSRGQEQGRGFIKGEGNWRQDVALEDAIPVALLSQRYSKVGFQGSQVTLDSSDANSAHASKLLGGEAANSFKEGMLYLSKTSRTSKALARFHSQPPGTAACLSRNSQHYSTILAERCDKYGRFTGFSRRCIETAAVEPVRERERCLLRHTRSPTGHG